MRALKRTKSIFGVGLFQNSNNDSTDNELSSLSGLLNDYQTSYNNTSNFITTLNKNFANIIQYPVGNISKTLYICHVEFLQNQNSQKDSEIDELNSNLREIKTKYDNLLELFKNQNNHAQTSNVNISEPNSPTYPKSIRKPFYNSRSNSHSTSVNYFINFKKTIKEIICSGNYLNLDTLGINNKNIEYVAQKIAKEKQGKFISLDLTNKLNKFNIIKQSYKNNFNDKGLNILLEHILGQDIILQNFHADYNFVTPVGVAKFLSTLNKTGQIDMRYINNLVLEAGKLTLKQDDNDLGKELFGLKDAKYQDIINLNIEPELDTKSLQYIIKIIKEGHFSCLKQFSFKVCNTKYKDSLLDIQKMMSTIPVNQLKNLIINTNSREFNQIIINKKYQIINIKENNFIRLQGGIAPNRTHRFSDVFIRDNQDTNSQDERPNSPDSYNSNLSDGSISQATQSRYSTLDINGLLVTNS